VRGTKRTERDRPHYLEDAGDLAHVPPYRNAARWAWYICPYAVGVPE